MAPTCKDGDFQGQLSNSHDAAEKVIFKLL